MIRTVVSPRSRNRRRRVRGIVAAGAAAGLTLAAATVTSLATAGPAAAAPLPTKIDCTNAGLLVSSPNGSDPSTLRRVSLDSGKPVYTDIGQLNDVVNGIGYNPADGLLYGYRKNDGHFVRFGENAGAGETDLGAPVNVATGQPLVATNFFDGAVGDDNIDYAIASVAGKNSLLKTDVSTTPPRTTVTPLTGAPGGFGVNDVSFDPYTGQLYTMVSGAIYSIDPATAAVTGVSTTPASADPNKGTAGGSWTDALGYAYFYQNLGSNGQLWRLDPKTGDLTDLDTVQALQTFDATACLPPQMTKTVSPSRVTLGGEVTFTFTFSNPTSTVQHGSDFLDELPAASGLSWVSGGVTPTAPGGGHPVISGRRLSIASFDLPNATDGPLVVEARAQLAQAPSGGPGEYDNTASFQFNGTPVTSDDPAIVGVPDATPFTVYGIESPITDDRAATLPETPVTLPILDNDKTDSPLRPESVHFSDAAQPSGATVSSDGKSITVPGEGTYDVNEDGTVTFTPVAGFAGTTSPVTYSVRDAKGVTHTATITVVVGGAPPKAQPDKDTTPQGQPVTLPTLANDVAPDGSPFVEGSLRLSTEGLSAAATLSDDGKTLVIPSEGTFTANDDGTITFTPVPPFVGTTRSVVYTVRDRAGVTVSSTETVRVTAAATSPLASTGVEVAQEAGLGLVLLLGGFALLLAVRRRRS